MKRISVLCIISACLRAVAERKLRVHSDKTPTASYAVSKTTDEKKEEAPDKAHNSRNSLYFEGVYEGVLPCAYCYGIVTTLNLDADNYIRHTRYLGVEGKNEFKYNGKFS